MKGRLSQLCDYAKGKVPILGSIVEIFSGKRPFVGAASIMGYTNAILYDEKILITGRVGTHGIIQRFSNKCWASDNTLVIKTHYYEFVYQFLKNVDFNSMNRGSTQPLMTQTDLKKLLYYISFAI